MEMEEVEGMTPEAVEIANLTVLGEDEFGLSMKLVSTDDDNYTLP